MSTFARSHKAYKNQIKNILNMSDKKINVKMCVLLPIVLAVTLFLWLVPVDFYGIEALTVVQQRVIALFVFAALMWMFEIIPNWTTSLLLCLPFRTRE